MAVIRVHVARALSTPRSGLPGGVESALRAHLSLANGDKEKALKLRQWGAEELPDFIDLWTIDGDELIMPRGYAQVLRAGLERLGHEILWVDETAAPQIPLAAAAAMTPIDSTDRPYQPRTVKSMLEHRQGIFQAPTAAGKTMIALEVARRAGCKALVLCDKQSLANQWRARAREHLGIEAGLIQGPPETWTDGPIVIGMIPTLNRSLHTSGLPAPSDFGMVIVDECHHAIAETWRFVIGWFCPRYLYGVTATPLDGDWRRPVLEALLGPVFQATDREELRRLNVISRPEVHVVQTEFRWQPKGRLRYLRDERTIYKHITEALIADQERNRAIVQRVVARSDGAHLINSKRKAHLQGLRNTALEAGFDEDRVWMLTGDESRDERDAIFAAADEGHCLTTCISPGRCAKRSPSSSSSAASSARTRPRSTS